MASSYTGKSVALLVVATLDSLCLLPLPASTAVFLHQTLTNSLLEPYHDREHACLETPNVVMQKANHRLLQSQSVFPVLAIPGNPLGATLRMLQETLTLPITVGLNIRRTRRAVKAMVSWIAQRYLAGTQSGRLYTAVECSNLLDS